MESINNRNTKIFYAISFFVSLIAIALVLFVSEKYGAGVSGDSIDYLSTADNIIRHHRFFDYTNTEYIYLPPLYPSLLAVVSFISGMDPFLVAGYLNAILFGLIVFLVGTLFYKSFPDFPVFAYVSLLFTFTSVSILRLASNITSDPLFIVLVLFFVIRSSRYLSNPTINKLIQLVLIAGTAALLRWNGVVLILCVVFLTLYAKRHDVKDALKTSLWAGTLSSSPLLLWVLGRNFRIYGTLFGKRNLNSIDPLANLADSTTKIINWYLPNSLTRDIPMLLFWIGFLILLTIFIRWLIVRRANNPWSITQHLPWVIFVIVDYLFLMVFTFTADHPDFYDDRYYAPLFPFTFMGIAVLTTMFFLEPLKRRREAHGIKADIATIVVILIAGVWLIFPSSRLMKYIIVTREHGESTYNLYNSEAFNESEVIQFLLEEKLEEGKKIYSNFPGAVYFFTRNTTFPAPRSVDRYDIDFLRDQFHEWPYSDEAYLVFFLPDYWKHYYTPQQLSTIADLVEVLISKDGGIYLVRQR